MCSTDVRRFSIRAARRRQRGLALVAVLWLVMLLAIIAASFTKSARTQIDLGRNAVEKAKAEALAEAGVNRAILGLLRPDPAAQWRGDGTVYALTFGGGEVRVAIQDEAGKIDLNTASDELLHGLFTSIGLADDEAGVLVDAVADFRDPDDLRRLNGAEDADYLAAGLPHGAKDAPFEAIEELQQVLGMTPRLYRRIAPLATVHSWEDGIDPLVAPPEVLSAVPGIVPAQVEAVLDARAGQRAGEDARTMAGTPETGRSLLERRSPIEEPAAGIGDPMASLEPILVGLEQFTMAVGGWIYSIRAEARTENGGRFVREAIVVLDAAEPPFTYYRWQRGE